jgi:Domain of unknown function (DUF1911)/Domain of unknown function (DUF1910)
MKEFSDTRRQQFLYEELYDEAYETLDEFDKGYKKFIIEEVEDKYDLSYITYFAALFEQSLDRLSLEYTAGKPIEEVKALYPAAVEAFEAWCEAYTAYHHYEYPEKRDRNIGSPVDLNSHQSYVQVLRLLSLGVLFNEAVLLRKIAEHLFADRHKDAIVEELFYPFVADAQECKGLYHIELYDDLLGAIWEDGETSTAAMQKFLKTWYKFYEGASWHNAHLRVGDVEDSPDWANYYGYWAWEAGALAYLYELDDRDYKDNILYPKDLVAWARRQGQPPKTYTPAAGETQAPIMARPGSACDKAGTWITAALLQERSIQMKVGEKFPSQAKDPSGNEVFWYWKGV